MPQRHVLSTVTVARLSTLGSIFSPIGNCNMYVVAPITRYTFKSSAGFLWEMLCMYCRAWSQSTAVSPSCFLTSTTAKALSPPYSNPALTMINSSSSICFIPWVNPLTQRMIVIGRGEGVDHFNSVCHVGYGYAIVSRVWQWQCQGRDSLRKEEEEWFTALCDSTLQWLQEINEREGNSVSTGHHSGKRRKWRLDQVLLETSGCNITMGRTQMGMFVFVLKFVQPSHNNAYSTKLGSKRVYRSETVGCLTLKIIYDLFLRCHIFT
jgi:hypothetical protein